MRITIITPLFPPDIGAPAPYVKTLVQKMTKQSITLIVYGFLPETVANIDTITIDKRFSKLKLISIAVWKIYNASKTADVLLVNNAPSTEFPVWICSFFIKTPIILCVSDHRAEQASRSGIYKFIHQLFIRRITDTINLPVDNAVYLPIEKLPFTPENKEAVEKQNNWWKEHIANIVAYVKK